MTAHVLACIVVVVALYLHHHIRPTERRHEMAIINTEHVRHGKEIGTSAMVERLNDLLERIAHARNREDVKNFNYYGGQYDGYRDALVDMGYSVSYVNGKAVSIEKR